MIVSLYRPRTVFETLTSRVGGHRNMSTKPNLKNIRVCNLCLYMFGRWVQCSISATSRYWIFMQAPGAALKGRKLCYKPRKKIEILHYRGMHRRNSFNLASASRDRYGRRMQRSGCLDEQSVFFNVEETSRRVGNQTKFQRPAVRSLRGGHSIGGTQRNWRNHPERLHLRWQTTHRWR